MPQSVMLGHGGEEVRYKALAAFGAERPFVSTFNVVSKERTAGGSRP